VFQGGILGVNCYITYNYVICEPVSILLLVGGGMVLLRRRGKRAAEGCYGANHS